MKSDLQDRIAQSADPDAVKRAVKTLAGRKRREGGMQLEDEINDTHNSYENRRWGVVRQHFPRTFVSGKDVRGLVLRLSRGGNPVDYTGHVNLMYDPDNQPTWRACEPNKGQRIPVEFDVKRMTSAANPSYRHNTEEIHQLMDLRQSYMCGTAAFLLVHHVVVERLFIIGPEHFERLMQGQGVTLYTKPRDAAPVFRHPSCAYVMGFGWNYAPLIPLACPGAFRPEQHRT